jgi:putative iron-dependent peroxidase
MPKPQIDVEREPGNEARFLIAKATASAGDVVSRLAGLPSLIERVSAIDRGAGLACAAGFGADFWNSVFPSRRPRALCPFEAINTRSVRMPATGGDLMFHIMSSRADLGFILAFEIGRMLDGAAEVIEDIRSMHYLDSRDLTGFIDGTENPKGEERTRAALIGAEDPDFSGGAYVFIQRYVHDLRKFAALPRAEQENTIGRSKPDSIEMPDDRKPPTAHISRVVVEENGEELQIVRYSFPYGTVNEAGLMFIAYTRDLAIPHKMLSRMAGTAGDGLSDRLLEYTRAVSGAHFFVPSADLLAQLTGSAKSR